MFDFPTAQNYLRLHYKPVNDDDDVDATCTESMRCVYTIHGAEYNMLTNSHYTIATHPHTSISSTLHTLIRDAVARRFCATYAIFSRCVLCCFCFSTVDILQLIPILTHSMHKNVRGCSTANHHHLIASHLGSSLSSAKLTSFVRILCAATMHGVNNSWMSAFDACHSVCERWFPRTFNQLSSQTQLDAFPLCIDFACITEWVRACRLSTYFGQV